ncbi:MAG: hypothetical protein K2W33_15620, partial [Burkholderiales bacterium]|nr:hypothetical protein [Burkholderiales bacterium]
DAADTLPEDIKRAENALANVSARIARLALSLNAPVATLSDFEGILNKDVPMLAQPAYSLSNAFPGDDHPRLVREWEELRGLLLLRCDMVSQLVKSHDLHTATTVLADIEAKLEREGFQPGAQGFNLLAYLSTTGQTSLLLGDGDPLPHPLS